MRYTGPQTIPGPTMTSQASDDKQPFDFEAMQAGDRYRILANTVVPRPIAWVTTQAADGVVNAAPFSFFNVFGADPAIIGLGLLARGPGAFKDTAANILSEREFVVQLVPERLAEAMNMTGVDAPPGTSEVELAGLHTVPSTKVRPPRLLESPVAFECRVVQTVPNGANGAIVLGEVVMAHVSRAILSGSPDRPRIDTAAMGLVGRMHDRGLYARTGDVFDMRRPTWTLPPKPQLT